MALSPSNVSGGLPPSLSFPPPPRPPPGAPPGGPPPGGLKGPPPAGGPPGRPPPPDPPGGPPPAGGCPAGFFPFPRKPVVCFGAVVPAKVNAAAAVESAVCDMVVETCVCGCAGVWDPDESSTSAALTDVGRYFLPT
jgi:hypothetical protein